ncbi:hypothetical protein QBC37DRAFT_179552 [Rhypophila decipiens]|uniref:Uncharacterized protein n=1 Tax=Rhypophila decipiens TaxID=261697 RepID=A0AAN6YLF9_9PEZI|nr:hypothetical protein QBC37DRAFT_179552 [Rhypophila decipiens]
MTASLITFELEGFCCSLSFLLFFVFSLAASSFPLGVLLNLGTDTDGFCTCNLVFWRCLTAHRRTSVCLHSPNRLE